jgi:hypothetical protein
VIDKNRLFFYFIVKGFFMEERNGTLRSWIELPRWAGGENFLKTLAFDIGVEITLDKSVGILRETIRFEATGTESKLIKFKDALNQSMKEYNT